VGVNLQHQDGQACEIRRPNLLSEKEQDERVRGWLITGAAPAPSLHFQGKISWSRSRAVIVKGRSGSIPSLESGLIKSNVLLSGGNQRP
jgi:hypothetical protein